MFEETHKKIGTHINSNFSEVRVSWDNDNFTPNNEEYWINVTILPGNVQRSSIGSSSQHLDREPGVITGQVLGPAKKGDGRHLEIADIFAGIFRRPNDQLSGNPEITFDSPYTSRVGPVDEGSRYQINVTIPFEADHIVGGA